VHYFAKQKIKKHVSLKSSDENNVDQDKETLISIVKEMTESTTGAQSTKHWAKDVLWFDIPPFASKGIQPAVKMFDSVFGNFKSCKVSILEMDTIMSGTMGIVCSIQKIDIVFKHEASKTILVRQTDCFKKTDHNKWLLFHQHASIPSGGEWDGRIITA
jgi:ketosteroid isomerase-like protein